MKFNNKQREGLAKITDNLATACMVAAIVGGLVDAKIGWGTAVFLFTMFFVLISAGLKLRKEGAENGN